MLLLCLVIDKSSVNERDAHTRFEAVELLDQGHTVGEPLLADLYSVHFRHHARQDAVCAKDCAQSTEAWITINIVGAVLTCA